MDMTPPIDFVQQVKAAQLHHDLVAFYMEWLRDKRPASQTARHEELGHELTPWCPIEQSGHAAPVCPYVSQDQFVQARLGTLTDDELAMYDLVREKSGADFATEQAAEQEAHQVAYDAAMEEYARIVELQQAQIEARAAELASEAELSA